MITPYSEKLESENLMYHMLPEHLIYISSGLLMCFGFEELILNSVISKKKNSFRTKLTKIYSKLIALNFKINSHGIVTAVLILIILIYWHIPEVFTFASEQYAEITCIPFGSFAIIFARYFFSLI